MSNVSKTQRKVGLASDKKKREKDDFYSTGYAGTEALMDVETFDGAIWECACGQGHISRFLEALGREVISTDLVDRGYGTPRVDFLLERTPKAPNIITNPPFKLTIPFIKHALSLTTGKVAMFLPISYLAGKNRAKKIWSTTPIARFYIFTWRVESERSGKYESTGGGMMNFMWAVWDHKHVGPPTTHWLYRQKQPAAPKVKKAAIVSNDQGAFL